MTTSGCCGTLELVLVDQHGDIGPAIPQQRSRLRRAEQGIGGGSRLRHVDTDRLALDVHQVANQLQAGATACRGGGLKNLVQGVSNLTNKVPVIEPMASAKGPSGSWLCIGVLPSVAAAEKREKSEKRGEKRGRKKEPGSISQLSLRKKGQKKGARLNFRTF